MRALREDKKGARFAFRLSEEDAEHLRICAAKARRTETDFIRVLLQLQAEAMGIEVGDGSSDGRVRH